MKTLYVLYDSECGFCVHCVRWLSPKPQSVELKFIPRNSLDIPCRFPHLYLDKCPDELVVVGDDGSVYFGAKAWIMCLYSLDEFREWSLRLSSPALLPFAKKAVAMFAKNRLKISALLGLSDDQLAKTLK
jgi:predicted DCC family thiol-disulfide oxidoreductase YuxK